MALGIKTLDEAVRAEGMNDRFSATNQKFEYR
jgi:hypothetical protein